MADWDPHAFTLALLADLRANDGVASSGPMAGQHLLILTTKGAKTGGPREAILATTRDGDAYVVAGSKGGDPKHPGWFHNITAAPECEVQVGTQTIPVKARVAEGDERERLWAEANKINKGGYDVYQTRTDRKIPVVVLEPR